MARARHRPTDILIEASIPPAPTLREHLTAQQRRQPMIKSVMEAALLTTAMIAQRALIKGLGRERSTVAALETKWTFMDADGRN